MSSLYKNWFSGWKNLGNEDFMVKVVFNAGAKVRKGQRECTPSSLEIGISDHLLRG